MSARLPTPTQVKALKMAWSSGALKRLAGGYWVASDSGQVAGPFGTPPHGEWVGTVTISACINRGWMIWDDNDRWARLSDTGRHMAGGAS